MAMEDHDLDSVLARHKKEQKALVARVTSLKKGVTKGEKAKRKEVLAEVQKLEEELKERHRKELSQIQANAETPSEDSGIPAERNGSVVSTEDGVPAMQRLKLDENLDAGVKNGGRQNGGKPKVNRQKARMVCEDVAG
jgi:hypothetical protein